MTADEWCETCGGIGSLVADGSPSARPYACEDCGGAGFRLFTCDGCFKRTGTDAAQTCCCCRLELCTDCACICWEPDGCDCGKVFQRSPGYARPELVEVAR